MTEIVKFEYSDGGCARIIVDDHCYVLQHSWPDWKTATHWFPEAVAALRDLPSHPDKAKSIREKYFGSYEVGSGGQIPSAADVE